jgi:DNA-directed RNA polymerase specialized sigma24 family protein
VDPIVLFDALLRLKAADDLNASSLRDDWQVVDRALRSLAERARIGMSSDRHDAHQHSLLGVLAGVRRLEAQEPRSAAAWLRTIYDHALIDHLRKQKLRRELLDGAAEGGARRPTLDELPAKAADDPRIHDPAALAPFEEALFEVLEEYVERTVRPRHRAHALIKAQLAYRWHVRREPMDALQEDAGVSRDTLYQWLHRGRVNALHPAVLAWLEALPDDTAERAFALELARLLDDADRADAGRPRPERRKEKRAGAVSPAKHWKSAQCDDEEPAVEEDDG